MTDLKNGKVSTVRGVVTEALPSTLFRVKIPARNALAREAGGENGAADTENDKKPARNATQSVAGGEIMAYLSGKMRMHRIKVLIGDSVEVVLDPYGGKGRIVKRL